MRFAANVSRRAEARSNMQNRGSALSVQGLELELVPPLEYQRHRELYSFRDI